MNKKNNYIWLIGENVGATANNNSFYFWKHIVNMKKDSINKYFIMEKNKTNLKIYNEMNEREKASVVWRNSLKHFILFFKADMFFVTLSYRDVRPEQFGKKKYNFPCTKPVIYLQHGVTALKRLGYNGRDYDNNMFRFVYYNKNIKDDLVNINGFRKYQLVYGRYFPRYKEMVRRYKEFLNKGEESNQLLWFLTWREYKPNSLENRIFNKRINYVLKNEKLHEYLKKNNLKLKFCIHQLYKTNIDKFLKDVDCENIEVAYASNLDLMDEIVKSKMLVTDYSSLGFEFTFLKKPVVLFQPDRNEYLAKRHTYCTLEELEENSIKNSDEFIDTIINEKYDINNFFSSRLDMDVDYDEVLNGKFIEDMYKKFKKIQLNKITFIGYNFYGVGGTVNATRALAEGLLEKGYLVELLSIKKSGKALDMPSGLNMQSLFDLMEIRYNKLNQLKKFIWDKNKKNFGYLNYDTSKVYLKPYLGRGLKNILGNIRSNTVISTRETFHPFLDDAVNPRIKNKIYFYHTQAGIVDEVFPGIMEVNKKRKYEKVVFVTEKNKEAYKELFDYDNYDKSLILGNTLERKNVRNIEKIEAVPKKSRKEKYNVIFLLRVSHERENDIENLIGFAKYLKEKKINNILIDVFGDGDYVDEFLDRLVEEDLTDIIHYKGKTNDSTYHIRRHDALVDFSYVQSFGMTYIEGVLSGKMVFCMKNTGSQEVMRDIPNAFYKSYRELATKIRNLYKITKEELQENYRKIEERYSRQVVAEKFVDFINDTEKSN